MKTCAHCGEEKPLDEFNRNRRTKDGRDHRCKPCHRKASTEWQRGAGKAAHAEAVKAYFRRHPEKRREIDRAMRAKFPSHWRARRAVREAIVRGDLVRPSMCSKCGRQRAVQAHHWRGYDPSVWLDVQWLCTTCHRSAHLTEVDAA